MGGGRSVAGRWLLARFVLGAGLLGGVVGQDNTEPTSEELACWDAHNGGAYFDPNTNVCEVCPAGRYDHDAINNMAHMNMEVVEGVARITWWDGTTDYNPVRAHHPFAARCAASHALQLPGPAMREHLTCARAPAGCNGMCRL
jgi:hypothetical protein